MRPAILLLIILFLIINLAVGARAQQRSIDTTSVKPPGEELQRELPQIQLEEYTIVGLARVTLPRKIRSQIFKDVKIQWSENHRVWEKELPGIAFQFSRIKPSILRLYEFPWLDARACYGSFNTACFDIRSQFRLNKFLPYFAADFLDSDGHTSNAQYTIANFLSGFYYQIADGHLAQLGTQYHFGKRGIWRDWERFQTGWEVQSTFWNGFFGLENSWSRAFFTDLRGTYGVDVHENGFQYTDRGGEVTGGARFQYHHTQLRAEFRAEMADISTEEGNLKFTSPDTVNLKDYEGTLLGGKILVQQSLQMFSLQAGVLFQQSREKIRRNNREDLERDYTYPHVSLTAGFGGWLKATVGYQPHMSLTRLQTLVSDLPFSEIAAIGMAEHQNHWQASAEIHFPPGAHLHISGSHARMKNYPSVLQPTDSLPAVFPRGGYPGWQFGTINQLDLSEVKAKLQWALRTGLVFSAWAVVRRSEVAEIADFSREIIGNKAPYLADVSGEARLKWNFYGPQMVWASLNYVGERYEDLANKNKLSDFLILNAGFEIELTEGFRLFMTGKNLLDKKYEEWQGFEEAGIHGHLGLRVVL
ncbi:MAG: hypothetical protein Kow0042_12170 [Calditrichia bacterium]